MADAGIIIRDQGAGIVRTRIGSRALGPIVRFRAPLVSALQIASDAAVATMAVFASDVLREQVGADAHGPLFGAPLLFVALCAAFGLYSAAGPSPYERFRLRAIASFCAIGLEVARATPIGSPVAFLIEASAAMLLVVMGHYAEAALRAALIRLRLWAAPTVIVGCDQKGRALAEVLLGRPEIGLLPVGFVLARADEAASETGLPLPVVGTVADFGKSGAQVALFTSPAELAAVISENRAGPSSPRLLLVSDAKEIGSLWLRPRMLGDAIGIEIGSDRARWRSQGLKRTIDLILAVPLAALALPFIVACAGLIMLFSPGPAFYCQERVGRYGRPIRILKLRTMYVDAEKRLEEHLRCNPDARTEWTRFFKLKDDPRILPGVGRFLRASSLDELPQLWNVICGDMSLVGPRPFPAYHLKGFDPEFRALRTSIQPGLTGVWQISARSNGDLSVQKAQDLFYIRNASLWLDLYVLVQTPIAVLLGTGAR